MNDFFSQLQSMNDLIDENTIASTRKVLTEIVEWFKQRKDYLYYCEIFAKMGRNLEVQTILDADGFFIDPEMDIYELPEKFQHDVYGICSRGHIQFSGRFVYPVKDVKGEVMGWCGYDKFSDTKYLDSTNYGYTAKVYSCWGMEELSKYYRSREPVYFVEGIGCGMYLRQCGMQSLATLSSYVSPYVMEIMKRFGTRAIYVADSDEAGNKCKRKLNRYLPSMRVVQSKCAKDVDDSRKVDDRFASELRKLSNKFYQSDLFV